METSPILRKAQAEALGCSKEVLDIVQEIEFDEETISKLAKGYESSFPRVTAHWHFDIVDTNAIPGDDPVYVVAQEFFDALPVNVLEYTKDGWRELLVDINEDPGGHHLKYSVAKSPTLASTTLYSHPKIALPASYSAEVGERIEVSIDRAAVAEQIGKILQKRKGASLIIDYGNDYIPKNTLRVSI